MLVSSLAETDKGGNQSQDSQDSNTSRMSGHWLTVVSVNKTFKRQLLRSVVNDQEVSVTVDCLAAPTCCCPIPVFQQHFVAAVH